MNNFLTTKILPLIIYLNNNDSAARPRKTVGLFLWRDISCVVVRVALGLFSNISLLPFF